MIDFEQDANSTDIADKDLSKVADLAERQMELENKLAELELKVTKTKEELRKVQEYELPDAMTEVGLAEFKHKNGFKISVKPFYSAKIDDTNRDACHAWLRDNGYEDLIKHNLTVDLGRGQDDLADDVKDFIKALGLSFVDKEGVHHSTLNAFIKEQVENGNAEINLDLFKAFIGRKSKISLK